MKSSRPAAGARPPASGDELEALLRALPAPSPFAARFLVGRGQAMPATPPPDVRLAARPEVAERLLALLATRPFHRGREVRTLAEARNVHGERALCTLAGALLLPGLHGAAAVAPAFAEEGWVERNVAAACAARTLAGRIGAWLAEEAFLLSALARIGVPALRSRFSDRAQAPPGLRRVDLLAWEGARLPFDHVEVGAALLDAWGLPPLFAAALRTLAHPSAEAPAETSGSAAHVLASLVAAADAATDLAAGVEPEAALRELDSITRAAGLTTAKRDAFLAELEPDVAEVREAIRSRTTSTRSRRGGESG